MYREMKNYENQQKYIFDGVGQYGIPKIEPTSYKECEFIGFNYANTCKKPGGAKGYTSSWMITNF